MAIECTYSKKKWPSSIDAHALSLLILLPYIYSYVVGVFFLYDIFFAWFIMFLGGLVSFLGYLRENI